MKRDGADRVFARIWLLQAIYYVITGIWPLVGIRSFQVLTGPKTDLWLVKAVAGLVAAVGAGVTAAGLRQRVTPEIALIGAGSGVALASVDVVYVAKRRISPVYLLDALGELVIIAGWIVAARRGLLDRR